MNIRYEYQRNRLIYRKELEFLHEIGMFRNILEAEQESEQRCLEAGRLMEERRLER